MTSLKTAKCVIRNKSNEFKIVIACYYTHKYIQYRKSEFNEINRY